MKMIGKVSEETHKELKQLSVEWGLTMSNTIQKLLDRRTAEVNKILKHKTPIKA